MRFTFPGFNGGMPTSRANNLGARGALLSALVQFFQDGRWGSFVEVGVEGQSLTAEDQLFVLMQAGLYLTATRGLGAPEARICYERAEPWCHSLNRPVLLYVALMGQWRYSLMHDKLTATIQIAQRVYSLAREQNNPAGMVGACSALAMTHHFLGDFEAGRRHAIHGIQIWRSGSVQSHAEDLDVRAATCLCYEAFCAWNFREIVASQANMVEAISLAKELNDMHGLASTLYYAASFAYHERNPAEVERLASDVIELSTRHHFAHWLALGSILRGWARSASGDTVEGVSWLEDGIRDYRATGAIIGLPYLLGMKAEALHLADRTSEAIEAIKEAEALVERFGERFWCAELHRLRAIFLAATGADEIEIGTAFGEAIRIAKEQKSISLTKRADATCAEYFRQKASVLGGQGLRLPLGELIQPDPQFHSFMKLIRPKSMSNIVTDFTNE
jgi:hypothetical protein